VCVADGQRLFDQPGAWSDVAVTAARRLSSGVVAVTAHPSKVALRS
jgi:hypothetical protein